MQTQEPTEAPKSEWFDIEVERGVDPIKVLRRMEQAGWTWHSFYPPDGRRGHRITGRRPIDALPVPDVFPSPKRVRVQPTRKARR
jgi:hypothetical protein